MTYSASLVLCGMLLVQGCEDGGGGASDPPLACGPVQGTPQPIPAAKLYFEFNSTDDDTGIHGLFDSSGWSELCVTGPGGVAFLATKPQGALRDFAVGGIFFESREPPGSEVPQADVLAMFPPGDYEVLATTFDGASMVGAADLTHDIPAPPVITGPAEDAVIDPANVAITWQAVTQTVAGDPVTISGYEVIVTNEDKDGADPHGMSQPIASIHVVPTVTSLTIPREFFEPATTYELEVIAIEQSGNQTITVSSFLTP